jgi:hypothetical protein
MKIIASQADIKLKPESNVLFMLYPWSTQLYKRKGSWWRLRDFLLQYRSNPRSIEYMLNLAKEFSDDYFKQTNCVDLLFSEKFKENIPQKPASIYKHIFHSIDEIKGKKYDAIILLFTDAIGLGWENIESNLPAGQQAPIFIINGRRRIFKFDTQSRRALQLRRFVARAWWLESLFGLFIIFCSVFFWLHDLVFGYTEAS